MLTPDWYEKCTADIIALYQQLEDDIIKDIVKKMLKTNKVTEKEKWQAEMLQEAGTLYSDIVQMVAVYTNQAADEVRKIFEEAAVELMKADNKIAERAGREPLRLSDSKLQTLSAMYQATMGNLQNLTNTTAATSQTAFISACNAAEMQVANGTLSYHDAIWNAIKQFAIGATVVYPSGHQDRIDVAISRAVRTGVGQAAAEISKANAEELGTDLMEITAHSGARPSHAAWQGKLVSLSGENAGEVVAGVRVLSLDEIGYGTGDGFRGWNCRHDWFPFFAEISELNYTEEQLKKLDEPHIELDGKLYTDYEVSQMQRKAERKIRALKRELVCYDAAGDKDGFSACSVKLKTAEQQLKDFLKETERDRESWREKVNKFDENNDSKRISDFKKELTFGEKSDIIKRDERIVSALKSGTITTKLNEDKQNPHILNSSEYDPAKNKSYFMISLEELQNIVDENYGTGEVTIGKNGIANAKEYITVSYDIGECIAEDGEHIGSTNRFRIHYSKSRTHAVPSKKKEENDESI